MSGEKPAPEIKPGDAASANIAPTPPPPESVAAVTSAPTPAEIHAVLVETAHSTVPKWLQALAKHFQKHWRHYCYHYLWPFGVGATVGILGGSYFTKWYYESSLRKEQDTNTRLTQQVKDEQRGADIARQERDTAKTQLAPFEAMALAKYTNRPMEESLRMLTDTLVFLTNRPNLTLEINGKPFETNVPVIVSPNQLISLSAINNGSATVEHVGIDISLSCDATNVTASGWQPEPPTRYYTDGVWTVVSNTCAFHVLAESPTPPNDYFMTPPFQISTNALRPLVACRIMVSCPQSARHDYVVIFHIADSENAK
jgi:hypothetical protein